MGVLWASFDEGQALLGVCVTLSGEPPIWGRIKSMGREESSYPINFALVLNWGAGKTAVTESRGLRDKLKLNDEEAFPAYYLAWIGGSYR
jgi:hypothetical protein